MSILRPAISFAVLFFTFTASAQDLSKGRWIDLTHSFNRDTVYWPTAKMFTKTQVYRGLTPGGWFYSAFNFAAAEHGGTHMDSPIHFADQTRSTDQVPLSQLIGPVFVINVTKQVSENIDYLIGADDIRAFEAKYGQIPAGAIVLLNTGQSKHYHNRQAYMGTDERGAAAVAKLHFPGLSERAAALLVDRRIGAVGIDTPSIDRGQSKKFASHVRLMTNNIPAFENVADMGMLPPTGATIIALPMKIDGGSGGPLRIVAHLPEQ